MTLELNISKLLQHKANFLIGSSQLAYFEFTEVSDVLLSSDLNRPDSLSKWTCWSLWLLSSVLRFLVPSFASIRGPPSRCFWGNHRAELTFVMVMDWTNKKLELSGWIKGQDPNSVWLGEMHLEYKNTKSLKINDRNKMYHKNGIWRPRWLWLISDKIDFKKDYCQR